MSDASVVFLPWVRQGLAARIATPDPLKTPLPAQAPLGVTVGVNNIDAASVGVRLFGPADVIGIDPRQVVRTEPPAGTDNYEANDLAAVEFDNPDLPWLFTPAGADGKGRLRPWMVLVVVRKQDGVRLRAPRTEVLPVLEIGAPAVPSQELPDLGDSWAWAHAQLGWEKGATEDDLRNVLRRVPSCRSRVCCRRGCSRPTRNTSRALSRRSKSGRLAGLGGAPDANAALTPAWKVGPNAPGTCHASGRTITGNSAPGAGGLRVDRRAFAAARLLRHRRTPPDGHRLPRLRRSSDDPSNDLPPIMLEGALHRSKRRARRFRTTRRNSGSRSCNRS